MDVKFGGCSDLLQFSDERVSYYLFVDSLKPTELLVCFSALVRWGESGGERALRKLQTYGPAHFRSVQGKYTNEVFRLWMRVTHFLFRL